MPEGNRKAALTRWREPDDPELVDVTRTHAEHRLAEHIREVVETAPGITPQQAERLCALLKPTVRWHDPEEAA